MNKIQITVYIELFCGVFLEGLLWEDPALTLQKTLC